MYSRARKHPPKFSCTQCSSNFTRKSNLEDHIRTSHEQSNLRVPCPQCAKEFGRRNDRDRHLRYQHQTEPQFVCGKLPEHAGKGCGHGFKRPDALKKHRLARNGKCLQQVFVGHEEDKESDVHLCKAQASSDVSDGSSISSHLCRCNSRGLH